MHKLVFTIRSINLIVKQNSIRYGLLIPW